MAQSNSYSFKPDDVLVAQWFAQLQEFKNNGTFCDITLKVENKEIQAHRLILAMSNPYFACMLQDDFQEKTKETVEIKGVDPEVLNNLVDLSYGVELKINNQNADKLLMGADFLHMNHVKTTCEDFLKSNLTAENVMETKRVGVMLNRVELVSVAEEFLDNNFLDFAKTDNFLELEKHELIAIIQRDELKVKEEEVYQAVLKWIKYEGPERIALLPEVLSNVRLCLLSALYLTDIVSKENLIRASPECRDLLDEAREYHMLKGIRNVPANFRSRPRRNFIKIYILGGENMIDLVSYLQVYDIREDMWISKDCAGALGHSDFGSAMFEGKLYMFGGYSFYGLISSEVKIFDVRTEELTQGRKMISTNSSAAATVLGDCIYVIGGRNATRNLNSNQRYSPQLDTWTQLAPLNQNRHGHGAVTLNGRIYAIGGKRSQLLNSCERYDPLTDTWTYIKPMISTRYHPGVAVLNGKLYACGGFSRGFAQNSCEVYDPIRDVWTRVAPMNMERYAHALIAQNGKLFAIGGRTSFSYLSSTEVYDPETDSWSFLAPLITPTGFMSFGAN